MSLPLAIVSGVNDFASVLDAATSKSIASLLTRPLQATGVRASVLVLRSLTQVRALNTSSVVSVYSTCCHVLGCARARHEINTKAGPGDALVQRDPKRPVQALGDGGRKR
jgi:hypothetical protein